MEPERCPTGPAGPDRATLAASLKIARRRSLQARSRLTPVPPLALCGYGLQIVLIGRPQRSPPVHGGSDFPGPCHDFRLLPAPNILT